MVSTKSNMGSFMVTWWGAHNGDSTPSLVDMDGKVHHGQLHRGKHFCALNWGSRRGMCESNQTNRNQIGGAHSRTSVGNIGSHVRAADLGALRSEVKAAITCVLCSGADRGFTSLPPPATRHGVVGLFSQLNHFVQELLVRIYRGEPPRSLQALYESTRLVGYGGGTIGDHFELGFTCSSSPRALDSVAEATKLLRRTPRYHVVGALLHLALVPKRPLTLAPVRVHVSADVRFDLAVHVRRGDRLWVGQRVEQIDVWSEQALLRKILDALNKPAFTAIGTSTEKKRVLLA